VRTNPAVAWIASSVLVALAGVVLLAYAGRPTQLAPAAGSPAPSNQDRSEPTFGLDDLSRAGVSVQPIADTAGLLDRDQATSIALTDYDPPDPDAKLDMFLLRVTASSSLRSDRPVKDLPVWIARYSNLNLTSPGGHELNYMYSFFDAKTGYYLFGTAD
jgi:hypothetical protein